jgi:hypothetical protein
VQLVSPFSARSLRATLTLCVLFVAVPPYVADAATSHPRLLLDRAEIEELRAVLASADAPPYLRAAYRATLDGAPRGANVDTGFDPAIYTDDWHDRYRAQLRDGTRASDAGLAYALTGDLAYAEAARTILLSWTRATVGGGRQHGVADMGFVGLAWAYDLIHEVLDDTDRAVVEAWLLRVAAPLGEGWHPDGPTADYYRVHYGHAAYQNEFAWLNLLYGAVGFVTGDAERIAWATAQQWPYDDFGHHPEFSGANARSLREFIRGGIYRDSPFRVVQETFAFFGGFLVVPELLSSPVPDGSMYDFWSRGPSPMRGGRGQFYQLFTLEPMVLLASMAWHSGDDVFAWTAPNGNRLKDGTDFARRFAARANAPHEDVNMAGLYELVHSHAGDRADRTMLRRSGRRSEPSPYFMRHKYALVGYADRSGGARPPSAEAPAPEPQPTPRPDGGGIAPPVPLPTPAAVRPGFQILVPIRR